MRVIITYDIVDNNTRVKVAKALGSIGERIQKSVFLCDTDRRILQEVLDRAESLIDHDTDAIHLFPQCRECHDEIRTYGQARTPAQHAYWVV